MESWKITLDRFLSSLISPAATWRCSTGFCLKGKKWQSGSTRRGRERESKNLANPPLSKIFDKNIRLGEDFIKQFKLKSGISYQYICEWFDYIYFLCLIPIQKLEIKIQLFSKTSFPSPIGCGGRSASEQRLGWFICRPLAPLPHFILPYLYQGSPRHSESQFIVKGLKHIYRKLIERGGLAKWFQIRYQQKRQDFAWIPGIGSAHLAHPTTPVPWGQNCWSLAFERGARNYWDTGVAYQGCITSIILPHRVIPHHMISYHI